MHKWLSAKETTWLCTIFQWGLSLFSHWLFLREPRIIPPWDLHVPFTCIIGSPAVLFLAVMLHNVCFILHLSLHKWCQEKNTCTVLAKPQRSSLRIHLCASERSERAIFWGFNSFTVKKVSFFTINVKSYLQKVGGGDVCTGHPPHPKKWGGGGGIHPPHPPGIYTSAYFVYIPISLKQKSGIPTPQPLLWSVCPKTIGRNTSQT